MALPMAHKRKLLHGKANQKKYRSYRNGEMN